MDLWDYHTHNRRCNHAVGEIEEYIKKAIQINLTQIGVSDHFPMFYLPEAFHDYAMTVEELPKYLDEANYLKDKYKKEIEIYIGLEVDYFPNSFVKVRSLIKKYEHTIDYLIGSIHAIPWNKQGIPVDLPEALPLIQEIGPDFFLSEYYKLLKELVELDFFTIIGHFDLPKKIGLEVRQDSAVWGKILAVIDSIENRNCMVEINTSGLNQQGVGYYPGTHILNELIKRDIPITLGSDAHNPSSVGFRFDSISKTIKKLGISLEQISVI